MIQIGVAFFRFQYAAKVALVHSLTRLPNAVLELHSPWPACLPRVMGVRRFKGARPHLCCADSRAHSCEKFALSSKVLRSADAEPSSRRCLSIPLGDILA